MRTPRACILTYRDGDRCPGCGRANWHVGRTMAECAFCGCALPLDQATVTPLRREDAVRGKRPAVKLRRAA